MALFKKDIALLVLQYLDDEGLKNPYRLFCQESKHLSDEWQALQRGLKRVNFSKGLSKCLSEHAKVDAIIREFIQCEGLKIDAGCDTDRKVEYVLKHFRPAFRSAMTRNKRRYSNVDRSESNAQSSPKRVKECNESYYSLMVVDTDARSTDTEAETEMPHNNSSDMRVSTPYQESDVPILDAEQKISTVETARDTLLDMPDLFGSMVAEKINSLQVEPSIVNSNPQKVLEELEKDQRFNDVFQELLEITATQNDLSQHDSAEEEQQELVEGQRELRQRVNKINYNDIANGRNEMKKKKPPPKKRGRKGQATRKVPDDVVPLPKLKPNERILETINENGEIVLTKVQIDVNPIISQTLTPPASQPSLPSLNGSVHETPQHNNNNNNNNNNGITILSSIPVQCIPTTSQNNVDGIILPIRPTSSGNNMIVDVTPNTFKFITGMSMTQNQEIVVETQQSEVIQVPITQEMIDQQVKTETPENSIQIINRQKSAKCLSTPSRKFPHVRTLSFKTPAKLETVMDESQNETDVTVVDKHPASCPPEFKGVCEDQGMKSDIEGAVDEGNRVYEPTKPESTEVPAKVEEIVAKPTPAKDESALEAWNRVRNASKNKNWDQHLREVNRHQEITVASEALRDTAKKKRKKVILDNENGKSLESSEKMYFKVPTPTKKVQKVRPTPQLAPPEEPKPVLIPVGATETVITSPQPSTSQEIFSPPSANESTISIIAMRTSSHEPLQISLSQLASVFPDTPFKEGILNMPVTPQISANPDITTPFTKFLNDLNLQSIQKNSEIATPSFAKTPGTDTRVSPHSTESKLASGYSSRATDYSSGSSYYKPDDIENKIVEQMITAEQMKATKEKLRRQENPKPSSSKEISDSLNHENILNRSFGRPNSDSHLNTPEKRAIEVAQLEEKKARTIRILKAQSQNRKKTQLIPPRSNTMNDYRRKKLSKIAQAAALSAKKKSLTPKKPLTPKKELKPVMGGKDLRKIAPMNRVSSVKKRPEPKKDVKSDEESIENIKKLVEKPPTPLRKSPRSLIKPIKPVDAIKEKSLNLSSSSSSSSSSSGSSSSDSESDSEDTVELNHELITCADTSRFLTMEEDPTFQKRRQTTDAPKLRGKPFALRIKDRIIKLTTSDVINLYSARSEDERRKRTSSGSAQKQVRQKLDQSGFEYVSSPAHGSPMGSSTPVASAEKKPKPIIHIHSKNGETIVPATTPDNKTKLRMPLKTDLKQNQQKQSKKEKVTEGEKSSASVKPAEDAIDALLNHLHPS